MANIPVNPATATGKVKVKTDIVGDEHVPVYKTGFGAYGDLTLIDADNPLPTANTARQAHNFARQEELLTNILLELRILNKYNSVGLDFELTDNDVEE